MTIVDRFPRLVKFIPMKTASYATDVARLFFDNWLCVFGAPSKIISDCDVRFQSKFWESLSQCINSRLALSTAYHPQTDGLTERYHRSIEQVLRCHCYFQQEKWCEFLSQSEFALNSTVADAHGLSPFEVVYGFVHALPLDVGL